MRALADSPRLKKPHESQCFIVLPVASTTDQVLLPLGVGVAWLPAIVVTGSTNDDGLSG